MSAANSNNFSQFLDLCGRPDGREDHDILKYRVNTTSVQRSHSPSIPPTILLGMKGIGKSTAFKILTSEHDDKFLVNGFAPGAERFKSLPLVQPGLYRERFYVMFLLSTISLITEHFDRSGNKKESSIVSEAKKAIAPITKVIWKNAKKVKGLNAFTFGVAFDLSGEDHAALDNFDRHKAEELLLLFKDKEYFVRLFVDDPEQSLPVGEHGENALIGLLLAANELNVNSYGVAGVTVLLKTHVFQNVSSNEELSNILPLQRELLAWTQSELIAAIERRLEYANCKFSDVFEFSQGDLQAKIIPLLRNGPRDMFAWTALAGARARTRAGARAIGFKDFEDTRNQIGEYSLGQITSAYKDTVSNVRQILKIIFPQPKWESVEDVSKRITDLRTNNDRFIELSGANKLDYSTDYIKFFLNSGLLQMLSEKESINPYEKAYFDRLERQEAFKITLHPLIAAAAS